MIVAHLMMPALRVRRNRKRAGNARAMLVRRAPSKPVSGGAEIGRRHLGSVPPAPLPNRCCEGLLQLLTGVAMKHLILFACSIAVLSEAAMPDAQAQRDGGAKARGEFGTGFWNPKYRRARRRSVGASRATTKQLATRRRSDAPGRMVRGDAVILKRDSKLMDGRIVLAVLRKGRRVVVAKVSNGWVGTHVEVGGKRLKGWLWRNHLTASAGRVAKKESRQTSLGRRSTGVASSSYRRP